jgi:hypothetical protein
MVPPGFREDALNLRNDGERYFLRRFRSEIETGRRKQFRVHRDAGAQESVD